MIQIQTRTDRAVAEVRSRAESRRDVDACAEAGCHYCWGPETD